MPVSTETRPELDLTIFTPIGEPPSSEVIQVLESFYNESPTVNVIWDCSRVTVAKILNHELQSIVQHTKQYIHLRPAGKTALVASSNLIYGLSRMACIFAELVGIPWDIEIFKDLDEAIEWIAVGMQAETQGIN